MEDPEPTGWKALFNLLFDSTVSSDLKEGRRCAGHLRAEVVPDEMCQRLRRRLPKGAWQFTTGEILFRRRGVPRESNVDWGGHSGYGSNVYVVYGWREHDGRITVHRLDRSLKRGDIEEASDDAVLEQLAESEKLRFVVGYRRGTSSHGIFGLPGSDPWSRLKAREAARRSGSS